MKREQILRGTGQTHNKSQNSANPHYLHKFVHLQNIQVKTDRGFSCPEINYRTNLNYLQQNSMLGIEREAEKHGFGGPIFENI